MEDKQVEEGKSTDFALNFYIVDFAGLGCEFNFSAPFS